MRRHLLLLPVLLLVALIVAAGCSGSPSPARHPAASTSDIAPESARTPDGARPQPPPPVSPFRATGRAIRISSAGLRLIETFEGYSRCAYWDPYGRVWTAGFGQTRGIYGGFCFAGRAAAEANLRSSVEREYQWAVRALGVNLSQDQVDALDSFSYNLGSGIFTGSLRFDLQHREFRAAAGVMLQYVHAGGVVLPGLVTRRRLEVALFLKPAPRPVPLRALLARRRILRRELAAHHCRPGPRWYGHAVPRWFHSRCGRWLREGDALNRQISARGAR